MTVPILVLRECSACGEQRAFEAVVCADGHGADCPELACVECGEAVLLGIFDFEVAADGGVLPHVAAAA